VDVVRVRQGLDVVAVAQFSSSVTPSAYTTLWSSLSSNNTVLGSMPLVPEATSISGIVRAPLLRNTRHFNVFLQTFDCCGAYGETRTHQGRSKKYFHFFFIAPPAKFRQLYDKHTFYVKQC
jgi:hypothetical protein